MEKTFEILSGLRVGFALCGSFCTFERVLPQAVRLTTLGCELYPIMSESASLTDTRFGSANFFYNELERIAGRPPMVSIAETEPIGPQALLDVLVVAPCTGNTLAKLTHGITDTSVTMACKAQLRNGRPVVLAVSSNDGLGAGAVNIGTLLSRKHIFFVPYGQDDPHNKTCSLVACMELIPDAIAEAVNGRQMQPLLV